MIENLAKTAENIFYDIDIDIKPPPNYIKYMKNLFSCDLKSSDSFIYNILNDYKSNKILYDQNEANMNVMWHYTFYGELDNIEFMICCYL